MAAPRRPGGVFTSVMTRNLVLLGLVLVINAG
jgi:hypothetical protein